MLLIYLSQGRQQLHDHLDCLQLFTRLDFSVDGKRVIVVEDWFWILRHHERGSLAFKEIQFELSFGILEYVFGVAVQFNEIGNQLELEEQVHASSIASLDQLLHIFLYFGP